MDNGPHDRGPDGEQVLNGSHLLVAVGHVPNGDSELETTGVQTGKSGFIPTNDRLETNVPGI